MSKKLVLASASPRRRALLSHAGYTFDVVVSGTNEVPRAQESPEAYVLRNAHEKAMAGLALCAPRDFSVVVLGADTIVVSPAGDILEKPSSEEDAFRMLALLRGTTHRVLSAFSLVDAALRRPLVEKTVETFVEFREISDEELRNYIATGEPFDKAGAYGVQERAAVFVKAVRGSYTNVVGLPLCEVVEELKFHAGLFPFRREVPRR